MSTARFGVDPSRQRWPLGGMGWERDAVPPRERRDAAEHRQRILAAARTLFARHGVDAVSMHQIAQEAGVGQGTLYRRYEHKGLLCLALLTDAAQDLQQDLAIHLEQDGAFTSPLASLDYLIASLVAFTEENGALLGAVCDAASGDRRYGKFDNPFYEWLYGVLVDLLERAAAAGKIPHLDAGYTADAILASLAIDLYLFQRRQRGFTRERIIGALRRLYHNCRCCQDATPTEV